MPARHPWPAGASQRLGWWNGPVSDGAGGPGWRRPNVWAPATARPDNAGSGKGTFPSDNLCRVPLTAWSEPQRIKFEFDLSSSIKVPSTSRVPVWQLTPIELSPMPPGPSAVRRLLLRTGARAMERSTCCGLRGGPPEPGGLAGGSEGAVGEVHQP